MKSIMEKSLKRLFSLMGIKITRTGTGILSRNRKSALLEENRFKWIQNMNIRTVIDVGANRGQSALMFHELFPDAKIYCFEPLRDCFLQMNANLKSLTNVESFNLGLGEKKGEIVMHRSEYSPSSSARKMSELHKQAFPHTAGEILETIAVDTLDNVAQGLKLEDNILLKADVQGFEDKVIMGALNILRRVKVIIIEISFHELYEDQPLFSDIYELLQRQGFVYSGSWSQDSQSPIDGAHLQQDGIFIAK